MRKQGGRLLGPENGEAVWVGCPSPEGMVRCPGPLNWARGIIGGGPGRAKALGVLSRPRRRAWLGQKLEFLGRAQLEGDGGQGRAL